MLGRWARMGTLLLWLGGCLGDSESAGVPDAGANAKRAFAG